MANSYVTVTDQFCGAGGSSLGAVASGAEIKMALNHWKLAIETHNANFPDTDHDCTDISACDPRRYASTDILITSPECTNHSLAKGAKRAKRQLSMLDNGQPDPAAERSRATMWDVCRFTEYHRYKIIIVENVPDARHWELWDAWLLAMTLLGYEHEVVYFNSMFAHPVPQSRDRMYVVFWKKGNTKPDLSYYPRAHCERCQRDVASVQSWKNPAKKWGKYKQQYVYRCPECAGQVQPYYYCAANAIDWSLPAPRIGDRNRPLKEKTLARIRYGLEKFAQPTPFLTSPNHSSLRAAGVDGPYPTQTAGWNYGLVNPFLVGITRSHEQHDRRSSPIDAPFPTQATGQETALCVPPMLVNLSYTQSDRRSYPVSEPMATQTARQDTGLCFPPAWLTSYYSNDTGHGLDEPVPTITTRDRHALVCPPFVVSHYGGRPAVQPVTDAMPTIPGMALHYIAQPGQIPDVDDCGFRMIEPHEVGAAMSFPQTYVVYGTKRDKVKLYGNAVNPPVMTWLTQRCIATLG